MLAVMIDRAQRVAFMLLPGLDHFAPDLIARLPCPGLEVRAFAVRGMADLAAACLWADDPARDVIWFEFCWPPFPAMIAAHDFAGRRVVMRVHRIEAYETRHAATAPWQKIDDVIVVSAHMAARLRCEAPALDRTTRMHVVQNGVDVERFLPLGPADPFRIGWCGSLILRKNPTMALEILFQLRQSDTRWRLHLCSMGGELLAIESFNYLKRRLGLDDAVVLHGNVAAADMPAWHAGNSVLLSTSLHESFGYAMAEAASCGCDVVMLDQLGAEEFWPPEMRFGTAEEAVALIRSARPNRWRENMVQHFSLSGQIEKLRALLRPSAESPDLIRIGTVEEILNIHPVGSPVLLDRQPADEMEAASFLLATLGYVRSGNSNQGILYRMRTL